MKFILSIIAAISLCFLQTSCLTTAQIKTIEQSIGTPQSVQADITILGGVAKQYIPASAQKNIHNFAVQLSQASTLNLTPLFALLPTTTGSQNGDALIHAAQAYLTTVVQRYGTHNQLALSYAKAVAAGLLANF